MPLPAAGITANAPTVTKFPAMVTDRVTRTRETPAERLSPGAFPLVAGAGFESGGATEAARAAHDRDQDGGADLSEPRQGPGQLARIGPAVTRTTGGGVGRQLGVDRAQQPHFSRHLGGQFRKRHGQMIRIQVDGGRRGGPPPQAEFLAPLMPGGAGDQAGELDRASRQKSPRVGIAFKDGKVGLAPRPGDASASPTAWAQDIATSCLPTGQRHGADCAALYLNRGHLRSGRAHEPGSDPAPDRVRKPGERSDLPGAVGDRDPGANPLLADSGCGTRPPSDVQRFAPTILIALSSRTSPCR